jgi:hypothetical protein
MNISYDEIGNECDDLKDALRDLLKFGANDDDEARVTYSINLITEWADDLNERH